MLVRAWETYGVMSRGTGKSSGIISPWLISQIKDMPRSQGGILGATFQQLLVRTLPPVISNWEKMGYVRDVHFIIGKEPTTKWKKMWNWSPPHTMPLDSKYAVYWFNGAVQLLISQDRVGSSNGLSLSYLCGDEAKLLNKERMDDEVMPTLRGDRSHFGHLSCYRGKMFTTDMPTNPKGKWILEKESLMDKQQIELIMQAQLKVNLLRKDLIGKTPTVQQRAMAEINQFERALLKLRKGSVYYAEADVFENLDVLGKEYVEDMRKSLSPTKFRTSILNERLNKIEGGFYGLLDESKHGTDWFNYNYIDGQEYKLDKLTKELDCRQDAGMIQNQPLDVSFDYGAAINCMVIGQEVGKEYRVFNALYVLHPQLIRDLVDKFCTYYKYYKTKEVNFYYDHTAVAQSGVTDMNYLTEVLAAFNKRGWHVNQYYCGQAPRHETKYEFWGVLLQEEDDRLPRFRYFRTRCEYLEMSMQRAGVKKGRKGFEKDKMPERDPNVPSEEATHLSDAVDTLLFFKYNHNLAQSGTTLPSGMY